MLSVFPVSIDIGWKAWLLCASGFTVTVPTMWEFDFPIQVISFAGWLPKYLHQKLLYFSSSRSAVHLRSANSLKEIE